jgi:hypothetical protein
MTTQLLRRWAWMASMAMLSSAAGALSAPVYVIRTGRDTLQVYQVIKTPGSGKWADAFNDSKTKMYKGKVGHLATIRSSFENQEVSIAMGPVMEAGGLSWIGATDDPAYTGSTFGEGDWRWIGDNVNGGIPDSFWSGRADGNSVNGAYVNWNSGEPNDFFGEDYADIAGRNSLAAGRWNDLSAGAERGVYVVEYDAVPIADFGHQFRNGHRYEAIAELPITWGTARALARSLEPPTGFQPGDLAIVDSQELQDFLTNLVRTDALSDQPGYHPWIGATDESVEDEWRWVDGRQFWQGPAAGTPVFGEYANWNAGEPNNFHVFGEDYAQFNPFDDGEWNDLNEEARSASYIVEWKPITELPGDYNGNLRVDAADYVLWRKFLGTNTYLKNEGPGVTPGMVTTHDYDFWRANFGRMPSGSGLGASAMVPEPPRLMLTLLAIGIPVVINARSNPRRSAKRLA